MAYGLLKQWSKTGRNKQIRKIAMRETLTPTPASPVTDPTDFNLILSSGGHAICAQNSAPGNNDELTKITTKMRDATRRAFVIISQISDLHKEPEKQSVWGKMLDTRKTKEKKLIEEFKSLLEASPCLVDLDARRDWGNTISRFSLLHAAAERGLDEIITMLLDHGANVDAICHNGSALGIAIGHGHPSTAELLLQRGADPNRYIPSESEAKEFGILPDVQHLPILRASTADSRAGLIPALVAAGADPNQYEPTFRHSALTEGAHFSNVEPARMLIACGANPNDTRPQETPLCRAAWTGTPEYIALMFESGANLLQTTQTNNETPIETTRFWNTGKRDEEKKQRLTLFEDRLKLANEHWQTIEQKALSGEQVGASLTARDIILCANVGKLDDVLSVPGWLNAPGHFLNVLSHLPPWIADHVEQHHDHLLATVPEMHILSAQPMGRVSGRAALAHEGGR